MRLRSKEKPTDCVFSLRVTRCGRWCPNGEGSSLHSCAYACCPCFLCQLASVPLRRVRGSALVIIPQVTTAREMLHPFEVMGVGLLSTGCWLGVPRSHHVCCTTSTSALSIAALSHCLHGPIGDPPALSLDLHSQPLCAHTSIPTNASHTTTTTTTPFNKHTPPPHHTPPHHHTIHHHTTPFTPFHKQDPVLFSGPLRGSLDPFHVYSDATIMAALDDVALGDTVRALPGGLDEVVAEVCARPVGKEVSMSMLRHSTSLLSLLGLLLQAMDRTFTNQRLVALAVAA